MRAPARQVINVTRLIGSSLQNIPPTKEEPAPRTRRGEGSSLLGLHTPTSRRCHRTPGPADSCRERPCWLLLQCSRNLSHHPTCGTSRSSRRSRLGTASRRARRKLVCRPARRTQNREYSRCGWRSQQRCNHLPRPGQPSCSALLLGSRSCLRNLPADSSDRPPENTLLLQSPG